MSFIKEIDSQRELDNNNREFFVGYHGCEFGPCYIVICGERIAGFGFLSNRSKEEVLRRLAKNFPEASIKESNTGTASKLAKALEAFKNGTVKEDLKLLIKGTPLQRAVWKTLLRIPRGKTNSYRDIARAVNKPRAMRAIGTAIGRNPIGLLIPCHRVINSDGTLGGFHYGPEVKKLILDSELKD